MKLGSLKSGRDGLLVVVSNDLTSYAAADHIAPTLQAALDDWATVEPALRRLANELESGSIQRERFCEQDAASPLPRAYQWADGSAYVNHVELVRMARNASMPESFWHDPLMYQGGSDAFLAPCDPTRESKRYTDDHGES
jgi:fumarylacetoacetate (FAA) hydrolase